MYTCYTNLNKGHKWKGNYKDKLVNRLLAYRSSAGYVWLLPPAPVVGAGDGALCASLVAHSLPPVPDRRFSSFHSTVWYKPRTTRLSLSVTALPQRSPPESQSRSWCSIARLGRSYRWPCWGCSTPRCHSTCLQPLPCKSQSRSPRHNKLKQYRQILV